MRTVAAVLVVSLGLAVAQGAGQAKKLLEKGEFQRAADAARKITAKEAQNVDAWVVLAEALIGLGEPGDAWEALETAMERNPKAARLSNKLGDVFVKMAEIEQAGGGDGTTIRNYYLDAQRMYDEALQKDPKSAEAMYGKANAHFWLDNRDDARKALADCLMLDKTYGKAHALQGYLFYLDKKYPAAQNKYEIALKLDDSDPVNHVRYGHCFYAQGKFDDAKKAYIAGLARHPDNDIPIRSGLYHLAKQDWRNLTPFMQEATKAAPNSPHAWFYLGYSHFVNDKWADALPAFKKADGLKPDTANYIFYVGYTREKQGDANGALDKYRKVLKINADHSDATSRFEAIILVRQNDIDEAEKLYDELLELAPNDGWIRNNYGLILRNWSERGNGGTSESPPALTRRRLNRSGVVYEEAAAILTTEAQIQSDCGLLFEFYPCNRDNGKAKKYFSRALEISDYVYRDAFDGLSRLCRRSGDWETLRDFADGVIGSLERGGIAIAPVGASAPKELPNETPGLLARAKAALAQAEAKLKSGG